MSDPTTTAAATAPAATPHSASGTVSTDGGASAKANTSPAPPAGASAPATRDAANEARSGKPIQRANVISNPAQAVDLEAPAKPAEIPSSLPQSTIDEMAAGKKALERNRPVATALENARSQQAGTQTAPQTNPGDATETLQQQGKV